MIWDVFKKNWQKFIVLCVTYLVFTAMLVGFQVYTQQQEDQQAIQVTSLLAQMTYTEEAAQQEIELLEDKLQQKNLNDSSVGLLYKAIAELSYMIGDDRVYNRAVGQAIFYLESSGEKNALASLYTQYMGRLYANGAYSACEELYDDLNEQVDLAACDQNIQIAYYLGEADVNEMLQDTTGARQAIDTAEKLLTEIGDYERKGVDLAKLQLLKARLAMIKNQFDEAASILEAYTEDEDCGLSADNMYVVCDFKLPFYELTAKMLLHDQKYEVATVYIQKYIDGCDAYNFRMMKLKFLDYVSNSSVEAVPVLEKYATLRSQVAAEILDDFSEQYGSYLLDDIFNQIDDMKDRNRGEHQWQTHSREIYAGSFCLMFLIMFFKYMLIEMRTDGLTRLRNRKCYEEDRERLYHRQTKHFLLIFDIDDFKKINDTLGHDVGDEVLVAISSLLKNYESNLIRCYRYGGEEICVIFKYDRVSVVQAIAEEMRLSIEVTFKKKEMRVTVSGGLACSEDGGSAFRKADHCLYEAKRNGKNQIVIDQ